MKKLVNPQNKTNNVYTGFLLGIVFPVIIFMIYYGATQPNLPLTAGIIYWWHLGILVKIVSLTVLGNGLLLSLFTAKQYLFASKGLIAATTLWALAILIITFLP